MVEMYINLGGFVVYFRIKFKFVGGLGYSGEFMCLVFSFLYIRCWMNGCLEREMELFINLLNE